MKSQEFQNDQMEDSVDDAQKKKKGGSGVIWFFLVIVIAVAALVVLSSKKSNSLNELNSPSRSVITTSPSTENRVPVRNDAVQWQSPVRRNTRQAFPPPTTTNEVKNFRGARTRKPGN